MTNHTITADDIHHYITETFAGLDIADYKGDRFYSYDPGSLLPPAKRMPFATLVLDDHHDTVSRLHREGVYRLNFGVEKETYRRMFGGQPAFPTDPAGVVDTGHDFSTLDQIMPHPVYAAMSWLCVLCPSQATFVTVKDLLAEAYRIGVERHAAAMT